MTQLVDTELLAELMAAFETGADLDEGPFTREGIQVEDFDRVMMAFLAGGVVDAKRHFHPLLHPLIDQVADSFIIIGFLQGLTVGHAYARRTD